MQPSPGSLSLTFDDGPDDRWTPDVLDALARCGARATFFVLGERVQAAPATARAVVEAGHDVQLHGHLHLRHSEHDEREIELDTALALDTLPMSACDRRTGARRGACARRPPRPSPRVTV